MPVTRRRLLQLGGAALATSLMPARTRAAQPTAIRRCVLLYMEGGASQIDTWDPKPGTANAAGLGAIPTAVPGVSISALLPRLARQTHRLALLRAVAGSEGSHPRARYLMHTGYAPGGAVEHPSVGAVAASRGEGAALPGYVSINARGGGAGFLPADTGPFFVGDPRKPPRHLAPSTTGARLADRSALRDTLDQSFAAAHPGPVARGQRAVTRRALTMMQSPDAAAFALDGEDVQTLEAYGDSAFGRGCLLARRLLERGVSFVEVAQRGWDVHRDHAKRTATLCADLDAGMSALLEDLAARDLLDSTLVWWMGDFGRTPWVSARGGRDHYPKLSPVVFAGAGLRTGQVIGATDADGVDAVDGPLTVPDIFRTAALALGLDPDAEHLSPGGRPLRTVDGGHAITALL